MGPAAVAVEEPLQKGGQGQGHRGRVATLQRSELKEDHHRFCDLHEPLEVDLAEEFDRIYIAYHGLGGNGTGTKLYEEIMVLPTISRRGFPHL